MPASLSYQRAALMLAFCIGSATSHAQEDFTFFEAKVRPVLVEHCYKCHSADSEKIKGGLRLDEKQAVLKGGDSGPAIVPGKPDESLLIKAIRYTDDDLQMPPPKGGGKKLPETIINDLVAWVKMGAPDPRVQTVSVSRPKPQSPYDFVSARTNWAFHAPQDPAVPGTKDRIWPKSAIDSFILQKLEEKNLLPSKPADKRTLIRRATFDLVGLPTKPSEIDDFLADRSTNAFAKVVDRLLASPSYGERWARHWLDVVRYTDSLDARVVGTEADSLDAWRYRDWVVNAFNHDLPYDQFIRQQVAGDLLPPPEPGGIDTNAIIATGMYAIGNWGNGDADKDKILTDIADDAVDVTGRAFLGLTLACARCHDHKFDPIPTADYYSLAGIFFSSHILAKLAPKGSGESLLRIPLISRAESERRQQRETRMASLEKAIDTIQTAQVSEIAKRAKLETRNYLMAVAELQDHANESIASVATKHKLEEPVLRRWVDFSQARVAGLFSQPVRDLLDKKGLSAWRKASGADTPSVVANGTEQEISFLTVKVPAHAISIHPSPRDGVAAAWKSLLAGKVQIKGRVADADPNCGDGIDWQLVRIADTNETILARGAIPNGGMEILSGNESSLATEIKVGEFFQLNVFPKGDYSCDSTLIELEITELDGLKRSWNLDRDVANDLLAGNPHPDGLGNPEVWYFRDLSEKDPSAPAGSGLAKWFKLIKQPPLEDSDELTKVASQIEKELQDVAMTNGIYGSFAAARGAFWLPLGNDEKNFSEEARATLKRSKAELSALRAEAPPAIAMAHGLQEGGVPESPHAGVHDVKIHIRGRYDRLGDLVPRRFPRLLAGDDQQPITEGSGRLPLAKWLASAENPLTARVMVNRLWQHHFGEGIVRTPNNYGKLGRPPTHPELLDYLAHRFVESGWSIKAMHRAIMLSAVYQESSTADPNALASDPENKLFGRMNRRPLDAESLRDSLLTAAGRLDLTEGGPAIRDLENTRRTLYLMTIRSDRSNYRALFDAADPTAIVEQRAASTVAPQALFLMNHPFALAQAKALAVRANELKQADNRQRITWLYQNLYGRPPSEEEMAIGLNVVDAGKPATEKPSDAWLEYCQALLCANEFVYVD